jgi:hypothetical protein
MSKKKKLIEDCEKYLSAKFTEVILEMDIVEEKFKPCTLKDILEENIYEYITKSIDELYDMIIRRYGKGRVKKAKLFYQEGVPIYYGDVFSILVEVYSNIKFENLEVSFDYNVSPIEFNLDCDKSELYILKFCDKLTNEKKANFVVYKDKQMTNEIAYAIFYNEYKDKGFGINLYKKGLGFLKDNANVLFLKKGSTNDFSEKVWNNLQNDADVIVKSNTLYLK